MGRASKGRATATAAPVVILVRPQLGDNIGMAARAMLNCGLSSLRLVSPRDGWPNAKAERAASGADVVLDKAKVFASVGEAVADLERVVATTARNRELSQRILTPRRSRDARLDRRGREGRHPVRARAYRAHQRRHGARRYRPFDPAQPAILLAQHRPGRAAGGL